MTDHMDTVVGIINDGQRVVSTNYWETEMCNMGGFYMSVNAGAYRLLVPPMLEGAIAEMMTSKTVVISRGEWKPTSLLEAMICSRQGRDAYELLFDDHTDYPFSLIIGSNQWDRPIPASEQGWKGSLHVYIESSPNPVHVFDKVYFRYTKSIPCLKPAPTNN